MKHTLPFQLYRAILWALLALAILGALAGCTTGEKVSRWNYEHPDKAAEWCAKNLPCKPGDSTSKTSFDSTGYLQSISDLLQLSEALNVSNDSLLRVLIEKDTACRKYGPIIDGLKSRIYGLQAQIRNTKPVIQKIETHVSTLDSAAVVALRLTVAKLQTQVSGVSADRDKWKLTAKSRFWAIVALIAIIVAMGAILYAVLKGKRKIKQVTGPVLRTIGKELS
jgi:hypothetical protein